MAIVYLLAGLGFMFLGSLVTYPILQTAAESTEDAEPESIKDRINDVIWNIADALHIELYRDREPEIIPELWRYPETGPLESAFDHPDYRKVSPVIIVVENEEEKQQVLRACEYLHDQMIDTEYVAVNELVHNYTNTDTVVVDPDFCAKHLPAIQSNRGIDS